jgi:hypothetical protein
MLRLTAVSMGAPFIFSVGAAPTSTNSKSLCSRLALFAASGRKGADRSSAADGMDLLHVEENMKKMRFGAAIVAMGLALAPWAAAQAPAAQSAASAAAVPPDQQPTKDQLARLFEVMRLRQQMQASLKMIPAMVQQQMKSQFQEMEPKLPGGAALKPAQQQALEEIQNRYMEKAVNLFSIDEMIDDMTGIYQRHLSRADVDAYIAFFNSTAGQHLLDQQPIIMQEYMPMVMKRTQERTRALTEGLIADTQAYLKSQTPTAAAPAAK